MQPCRCTEFWPLSKGNPQIGLNSDSCDQCPFYHACKRRNSRMVVSEEARSNGYGRRLGHLLSCSHGDQDNLKTGLAAAKSQAFPEDPDPWNSVYAWLHKRYCLYKIESCCQLWDERGKLVLLYPGLPRFAHIETWPFGQRYIPDRVYSFITYGSL